MEKIQMDALLAVQTTAQTNRYQAGDRTKTDFSQLLKGQNQTVSSAEEAKASQKPDSGTAKETTGPVKDGKTEEGSKTQTDETEETKDSQSVSAELLLQLQETAGLVMTELPAELEGAQPELAEPGLAGEAAVQEPVVTMPEQPAMEQISQTTETGAVPEQEAVQTSQDVTAENAPQVLQTQKVPEKPFMQEAKAEPVKDGQAEEIRKGSEASGEAQSQTVENVETTIAPVKAQAETPSENKTKEEAMPQQTFSGMEHLQLRSHSVGEMDRTASAPVQTTESTLVDDVGRTLAERFPQTNGTLTIELEPASLGKLTIQVLYESGKAMVSILATNPRTLELLSQKASELGAILEEHTGQETVVYTQQPESEQAYDERQREDQREDRGQDEREQRQDQASQEAFAQQLRLGLV